MSHFSTLFSPIDLGPVQIRNRIFNPPHGTTLGHDGKVTDDLIAYHEARARGGVGLIIIEGMTLHPTYGFPEAFLYAGDDAIIEGLRELGERCRDHGTPVFGQLFHAGRAVRLSHDGSRPVVYSASDIPDERYRVVPAPMSEEMIWEIIESYVAAARRLAQANMDGVEILASMGYLISQFLNPKTNRRQDAFGGSPENRLRLLREILARVRAEIGRERALGIRLSMDERTDGGMDPQTMAEVCRTLEADGEIDYFNVIAGSSAAPESWIHVFPPMALPAGYVSGDSEALKKAVSKPVLVAGRINQPQVAQSILDNGQADMVGMVRALIADPEFPNKAQSGRAEDIRACIGCNQACVGHRLAHHRISCIQNPVTGREREMGELVPTSAPRSLLVIGGGPGGMKAAAAAAARGHRVTLMESQKQLGGQALLAQALPGRAEFGGVITNLTREMELSGVSVQLGQAADAATISDLNPDAVILATGARVRPLEAETGDAHVVDSWSAVSGSANIGTRVVIADWACDWSGLGLAEKLARDGCHVRLLSGGVVAGESIQSIVRDQWIGELHKLGVEMVPYARFFGADGDSAYFQHMISGEPIICEEVDSVVTCFAPERVADLQTDLERLGIDFTTIGDAVTPRTVEEAVLEGYRAALAL